ncbi:unnamed protein product [Schistocephalus solidus]|uniref:Myeloid leukemia factor n=1 Tax=Schistocephalus solidus TaxID=70667 RepID=A0A183SLH4_SCHSO|nr:unnamed protein product [Schistocephalus solidus]
MDEFVTSAARLSSRARLHRSDNPSPFSLLIVPPGLVNWHICSEVGNTLSAAPARVRSPYFGLLPGSYNINSRALLSTMLFTLKTTMKLLLFFLLAFALTAPTLEQPYRDPDEDMFFMQGEDDHFLPRNLQHNDMVGRMKLMMEALGGGGAWVSFVTKVVIKGDG